MLEKLSIRFIRKKKLLSIYELELFIELLENHINWNQVIEIMNLENDDDSILKKIDPKMISLNNHCRANIPRVYRFNWLLRRIVNKRKLEDLIKKTFIYPIFLWLLSLNLITFLVIYILPSTINTFSLFSNEARSLKSFMLLIQFIVGIEWGILLITLYLVYTIKKEQLTHYYLKLFKYSKYNIFVHLLSYLYLFDFVNLLNLDITLETLFNTLKTIEFPMYAATSDKVLSNLRQGKSLKTSFDYLDITFLKIITIDDYERKINHRIEQYLNVLRKQIDIGIQKYANICLSIVYFQIGLMVFVVYSILLYPLKLLEGMNL